jgi:polyferredoxin
MRSNPNWTHRRRLIYASVGLSFGMILWGAWVWRDGGVASTLIQSGTTILVATLSGYVFGAVLDDHWQNGEDHHDEPQSLDEHP